MYVLWNTHMCIQIWINILCVHGLNICHISSCIGRLSQIEDYWYTSICTSCSFVGVLLCSMTMKKDERISSHDDPWLCKIPKETGDVFFRLFFRRLAADLCHSTSPGRPQLQDSTLGWRYGLNVVIFKPCAKITFARTFRKLKWKNVNKWILNKLNATLNHDIFIKSDKDTKIKSGQIRAVDFSISIDKSDAVSYSAVGIYSERSRPRMKKLQKIPWSHHSFFLKWLKKPCTKKRLKRPFFKDL